MNDAAPKKIYNKTLVTECMTKLGLFENSAATRGFELEPPQ